MELSIANTAPDNICLDWHWNRPIIETRIALWRSTARCGEAGTVSDLDITGAWITPAMSMHDYIYGIRPIPKQGRCKYRRLCAGNGDHLCDVRHGECH